MRDWVVRLDLDIAEIPESEERRRGVGTVNSQWLIYGLGHGDLVRLLRPPLRIQSKRRGQHELAEAQPTANALLGDS